MNKSLIFLGSILLLGACKQNEIDTKAEGEKLMQLSRDWSRAAATHDVEKILSYWSDDAVMISPGEATRKGKDAIRQMVEGSFKNASFQISWEPKQVEISKSGDLGYLLEETQITINDSTGKPMTRYYNAISIWKKQSDGNWKNVVDALSPKAE